VRFAQICLIASTTFFILPAAWADSVPQAEAAKPQADVATLLFGNPQWGQAPVGATITYAYSKKTSQAPFGAPFDDHIVLKLEPGEDTESRTADVKMFFGVNAKPAGPFSSAKQNPVLLLVMEENVQEMSKLFKANPRYLKNAIRKAWRDDAKIVAAPIDVDGKSVPGTKITVTPFVDDPEKDKMMGLERISYTVEIADSVPGNIAKIDIDAPGADGKSIFNETLSYKGVAK
jgi:hypothetical protein